MRAYMYTPSLGEIFTNDSPNINISISTLLVTTELRIQNVSSSVKIKTLKKRVTTTAGRQPEKLLYSDTDTVHRYWCYCQLKNEAKKYHF